MGCYRLNVAAANQVILPGAETGPGGVATWGRATADRADAFGFKWDRTGKSSKLIAFEWSGPD